MYTAGGAKYLTCPLELREARLLKLPFVWPVAKIVDRYLIGKTIGDTFLPAKMPGGPTPRYWEARRNTLLSSIRSQLNQAIVLRADSTQFIALAAGGVLLAVMGWSVFNLPILVQAVVLLSILAMVTFFTKPEILIVGFLRIARPF